MRALALGWRYQLLAKSFVSLGANEYKMALVDNHNYVALPPMQAGVD